MADYNNVPLPPPWGGKLVHGKNSPTTFAVVSEVPMFGAAPREAKPLPLTDEEYQAYLDTMNNYVYNPYRRYGR